VSPPSITNRVEHLAQAIAERVVNLVLDSIDLNAVVDKIDVQRIIDKVDINEIIDRVDMEAMIDKVDVGKVIEKVDINAIISQVDVDALVRQTELGSIIARSTTGVVTEILDVVRASGVGLDDFIARMVNRILRRDPASLPVGPPLLVRTPPAALAPAST
jgi:hypothetical protein